MLFTFVLLIAITSLTVARQQTFTATGTLQCNNKPAAGQTVQLKFTDPLLKGKVDATVKTAADGSFKISGTKRARASQKAYLWIEHNCDAKQRIIWINELWRVPSMGSKAPSFRRLASGGSPADAVCGVGHFLLQLCLSALCMVARTPICLECIKLSEHPSIGMQLRVSLDPLTLSLSR
ncbi:hypothetical protein Y032_0042g606 [Ancylostoma ceylanicum]|uniref:Transthyretin-like family protein n=1 Tax=Ancylostoma ceylanicum TaxID=53326 RepID=A0A016UF40_9BILA|nr:hypothetical protein Y032_0042g606 [Ancylostoma ceylanicum]